MLSPLSSRSEMVRSARLVKRRSTRQPELNWPLVGLRTPDHTSTMGGRKPGAVLWCRPFAATCKHAGHSTSCLLTSNWIGTLRAPLPGHWIFLRRYISPSSSAERTVATSSSGLGWKVSPRSVVTVMVARSRMVAWLTSTLGSLRKRTSRACQ